MRYEAVIKKFDYLPSGLRSPAKYNDYVIVYVDEPNAEELEEAIKKEVSRQEGILEKDFNLLGYMGR